MRRGEVPVQGTARRRGDPPVRLKLGFGAADAGGFGYAIEIGLPQEMPSSAFTLDPEIKAEAVFSGPLARPAALLVAREATARGMPAGARGRGKQM